MSWPMVKLGDICSLINGDRGKNYPSKDSLFSEGIPFINAGNLNEDLSIVCSGQNFITEERYNLLSNGKVQKGDILFCLRGSLGKFAIVDSSIAKGAVASSLVIIRPLPKLNLDYLKNYLRSSLCKIEITRFENGAAQPNLSAADLRKFEIPMPFPDEPAKSLVEQKRIAAILDKADAIRRKRKQAIKLADDFLRSVFLDMFGDPVTNPKGWEVKAIKELATVTTGNTPSRKVPEYFGNDVEWIKSDNINTPHHILTTATEYLSHEGVKVARTVPKGSTLITCIAGSFDCIGNAAFANREVSFNQQINALTPKDGVLSWFLYALIIFSKKIIQNASTNSMKGMISKGKLEEVKLFLPPLDLQRQFEDILDKQTRTVERMNSSNESDHELSNSLSQKAFAGEL